MYTRNKFAQHCSDDKPSRTDIINAMNMKKTGGMGEKFKKKEEYSTVALRFERWYVTTITRLWDPRTTGCPLLCHGTSAVNRK